MSSNLHDNFRPNLWARSIQDDLVFFGNCSGLLQTKPYALVKLMNLPPGLRNNHGRFPSFCQFDVGGNQPFTLLVGPNGFASDASAPPPAPSAKDLSFFCY